MADEMIRVTDDAGKKLGITEMDPADQLDLFEACGPNAANISWVGMALLVCSVREVDGVPIQMPKNPVQVKQLARKLGKDGVAAVSKALNPPAEAQEAAEQIAKN